MIVVHFFLRTTRGKTYLMADSSSTEGLEPAFGSPVVMFEVSFETQRRSSWVRRAKDALRPLYPGAKLTTALPSNARKVKTQVFDIIVTTAAGQTDKPRTIMSKLKGLIK